MFLWLLLLLLKKKPKKKKKKVGIPVSRRRCEKCTWRVAPSRPSLREPPPGTLPWRPRTSDVPLRATVPFDDAVGGTLQTRRRWLARERRVVLQFLGGGGGSGSARRDWSRTSRLTRGDDPIRPGRRPIARRRGRRSSRTHWWWTSNAHAAPCNKKCRRARGAGDVVPSPSSASKKKTKKKRGIEIKGLPPPYGVDDHAEKTCEFLPRRLEPPSSSHLLN